MDSSHDGPGRDSLEGSKIGVTEKRKLFKSFKRRRTNTNSPRSDPPTSFNASGSSSLVKTKGKKMTFNCKNSACPAILRREDKFCKMCSCCLCHKFDQNKDTSLWLMCNSDPPFSEESCGFSCHLDCAFKSEQSGIKEENQSNAIDGCFSCVNCNKTNSLIECWKMQLIAAEETTSVEIFCCRILLAQVLLKGTEKFRELSEPVDKAVKLLEAEFDAGPLNELQSSMCRGFVSRLRSAPQVKRLCGFALKLLKDQGKKKTIVKDIIDLNVDGVKESTDISREGNKLCSSAMILFEGQGTKKIRVDDTKELNVDEVKDISREGNELTAANPLTLLANSVNADALKAEGERVNDRPEKEVVKLEKPASCGFRSGKCGKILRELERLSHIKSTFRERFVSWFSLRATSQEKKVVRTFIKGFEDDLQALGEQLVDTFSCSIYRDDSAIGGCGGGGGGGNGH